MILLSPAKPKDEPRRGTRDEASPGGGQSNSALLALVAQAQSLLDDAQRASILEPPTVTVRAVDRDTQMELWSETRIAASPSTPPAEPVCSRCRVRPADGASYHGVCRECSKPMPLLISSGPDPIDDRSFVTHGPCEGCGNREVTSYGRDPHLCSGCLKKSGGKSTSLTPGPNCMNCNAWLILGPGEARTYCRTKKCQRVAARRAKAELKKLHPSWWARMRARAYSLWHGPYGYPERVERPWSHG